MELRHLLAFVTVAEEGSFTRAGERLGTAQSAVSTAVRRLERELGTALFDRTTHRVALTDAGSALLPAARRTLAGAAAAREAVDRVRGGLRGTIRMGTMQAQAMGAISTAAFVVAFRTAHPDVRVEIEQAGSGFLADLVREGRLDLAIVGLPGAPPAGVELTELARHPVMLACAPEHPFARRTSIDLATIAGEPMADFPPGWSIRISSDRVFAAAGLERRLAYEVNDSASIVDIVRHGLAVALIAQTLIPDGDTSVVTVPLEGVGYDHRISLAAPTTRPLGLAAQALRDLITASA